MKLNEQLQKVVDVCGMKVSDTEFQQTLRVLEIVQKRLGSGEWFENYLRSLEVLQIPVDYLPNFYDPDGTFHEDQVQLDIEWFIEDYEG